MRGLAPDGVATVKAVSPVADQVVEVIYQDPPGTLQQKLIYRDDEPSLELAEGGRPWSFDGDGELLRLLSEAYRIKLAWLFDPYLAITTSPVEPLPHQITAVYEEMLPRQPMRFLLADDPGAGKTIMAGLLIRELIVRGDLERCLVGAPTGGRSPAPPPPTIRNRTGETASVPAVGVPAVGPLPGAERRPPSPRSGPCPARPPPTGPFQSAAAPFLGQGGGVSWQLPCRVGRGGDP